MEEATTWKNHTFTLLIFGGIIVLCSIFFVLGMVVGRNQGRQIAEKAFQEREAKGTPSDIGEDTLKLNYFNQTTGEKPKEFSLEPAQDPPPAPRAEPARPSPEPSRNTTPPPPKRSAPPAVGGTFLQVFSSKNEKQARAELKRVKLKGFEGTILEVTKNNEKWFRVVAGPYKESQLTLAKKDLAAKGYKDAVVPK